MCCSAKRALGWSLGLLLVFNSGRAQDSQPSEYQLKAAFLFNFAKFVEWPPRAFASDTSPIVVGVLGQNPFGADLESTVQNKAINNRPFTIKEFRSAAEATNCHILFISTSEKEHLPEILEPLQGASVLTVSESPNFIESGGIINFVREGNKIRFQVSDEAAKRAGLKISSKLLSLAVSSAK